jgi:hypothetical protein
MVLDLSKVKQHFSISNFFSLGVGNPAYRLILLNLLEQVGGKFQSLKDDSAFISNFPIA